MYCRTAYTVGAIAEVLNALGEPRWDQALIDAGRDREVRAAYRETGRPCAECPFRVD